MVKINKHLYKNSFLLSLPGIISIFLSIISIPFHIEIAGLENYGYYLFFHFILSFSFLLNFGLAKTLVIAINKNFKKKNEITYNGLKYCFGICLILILIFFFIDNLDLNNDILPFSKNFFIIGLIISIIYLIFESIFQANKFFKNIALSNFVFYSLSLTLPSILLILIGYMNVNQLILISIIIKFTVIVFMLIIIIYKKLIKRTKKDELIDYLKINSLWITLFNLLVQFYEMFDKYFVSIFLGPISLSLYSIPQQITGKLTVISRAFSSYLLPYLSSGKKNLDFNQSINLFLTYVPVLIFILFPLYEKFLQLWLGNSYNSQILELTKVFSLIAIFSSNSHLLITKYEADQTSKKNFYYEISILPIFLFLLIIFVTSYKSLLYISFLILVKEAILLFIRLFNLKEKIFFYTKYFFNIIFFIILLILSSLNYFYFYFLIIIFLIINFIYYRKLN